MKKTDVLRYLSSLTQLGFSIAFPPILCIFFGLWLQKKWGVGDWVIVVCLLVGIVSGACSFLSFVRTARFRADRTEKKENDTHETGQGR